MRGFGVACYLHGTGGIADETSEIEVGGDANAGITVRVGTQSSGQGHATVFAQIVAQRLGLPVDSIHVVQGDTHAIARPSFLLGITMNPLKRLEMRAGMRPNRSHVI